MDPRKLTLKWDDLGWHGIPREGEGASAPRFAAGLRAHGMGLN